MENFAVDAERRCGTKLRVPQPYPTTRSDFDTRDADDVVRVTVVRAAVLGIDDPDFLEGRQLIRYRRHHAPPIS
jgi:hypothetical protein